MDQQKIGTFLKHLRKEKELTQEQLAEHFHVSSKTVSRWETGSNLPDVEMLLILAEFYNVDIRDLLDGEKRSDRTGSEASATVKTVAAYVMKEEKKARSSLTKIVLGVGALVVLSTVLFVGRVQGVLYGIVPEAVCDSILLLVYLLAASLAVAYLKAHWFLEKPAEGPGITVQATVVSKDIKPGTHHAGRSKGGFSYVVYFQTADGQMLELFTYEIEFGGLKEGTQGLLTYQDRYFVRFEKE